MTEIEYIEIDPVTRKILSPAGMLLGVMEDANVERKYFKCPKIVGDNVDLSAHQIYIKYTQSLDKNGEQFEDVVPGIYHCEDVSDEGDYITFSWKLSGNVCVEKGFIAFSVVASDGGEVRWNTYPAVGAVLLTIPGGLEEVAKRYPDIISQLLNRMDAVEAIATPEAMQNYVEAYLAENPPSGMTDAEREQLQKNTEDIGSLSEEMANKTGAGLSTEAIDKLEEVGNYLAYTTADGGSKWTELIAILRNGSSGSGSGETFTLQSISATYSGSDVAVGTALTDLTDITVTAHYSDGSTANVTDYTLSGEIAEGSNTITVSYGGKTTFTVAGIAESGGEDFETNGWTNGTAYNIDWIDGYRLRNEDLGEPQAYGGRSITQFMPCQNANRLNIVGTVSGSIFWYDAEQNYLRYTQNSAVIENTPIIIPTDAYYFRLCVTNENTSAFLATPYRDELLTKTTAWESDKFYRMEFTTGQAINPSTGTVVDDVNRTISSEGYCYGASTIEIFPCGSNMRFAFYDVDGEYLGNLVTPDATTGTIDVPENVKTFRYHDYSNIAYYNNCVKLS